MKVTNKQILEALENNEAGKTQTELAAELGISQPALSQRLTKLKDKIKDQAKTAAEKRALNLVCDLERQSRSGKTEASRLLLEIAGVYTPKKELDVNAVLEDRIKNMRAEAEELADRVQWDDD